MYKFREGKDLPMSEAFISKINLFQMKARWQKIFGCWLPLCAAYSLSLLYWFALYSLLRDM